MREDLPGKPTKRDTPPFFFPPPFWQKGTRIPIIESALFLSSLSPSLSFYFGKQRFFLGFGNALMGCPFALSRKSNFFSFSFFSPLAARKAQQRARPRRSTKPSSFLFFFFFFSPPFFFSRQQSLERLGNQVSGGIGGALPAPFPLFLSPSLPRSRRKGEDIYGISSFPSLFSSFSPRGALRKV